MYEPKGIQRLDLTRSDGFGFAERLVVRESLEFTFPAIVGLIGWIVRGVEARQGIDQDGII